MDSPNGMDREAFYDAEIAPEMARLAKLCQDRGLAFYAYVEFDPSGEIGITVTAPEKTSFAFKLVHVAGQAKGCFDALAFAVAKSARETGHSSLVLKQMGIPLTPTPADGLLSGQDGAIGSHMPNHPVSTGKDGE